MIDGGVCDVGSRMLQKDFPGWTAACTNDAAARVDIESDDGIPTIVLMFCSEHFQEFGAYLLGRQPNVVTMLRHDAELDAVCMTLTLGRRS